MTPKEKAIDLVNKFYSRYNNFRKNKTFSVEQKRMAIIAVDEIVKELEEWCELDNYWKEVKQEIEKL
jgi:ABC-type sugar transport system ATPase subunit